MGKKGAGNIEFVLSFILFVGFVASALYFFNPMRSVQTAEFSKDFILSTILKNVTVEMDSYSVLIQTPKKHVGIALEGISPEKNARVEDYYGNEIPSKRTDEGVCLERDNSADSANFVIIHFSEDFKESLAECGGGGGNFEIASSLHEEVISETRVSLLNKTYHEDYGNLKKNFDIPAGADFSFSLEFQNGQKIAAERSSPLRAEVFSETKLMETIRLDGSSEFAYFTVRAW